MVGSSSVEYTHNGTIYGDAGNDTIYNNHSDNGLMDSGSGDDEITSNKSNNVTMIGGTGNDTINNFGSTVLYKYAKGDGNDIITGFNSTSTLSIAGSSYTSVANDVDIIITVGKNNITLVGAGNLDYINVKNDTTPAANKTLTINNKSKANATLGATYRDANATKRKKAVKIIGNAANNSITGGAGKDTLWGGTGKDTLMDGKGKDLFIYDAGNDVIADYAAGDKISIGAAITKAEVHYLDVVFTVGRDSLTVKNGSGKKLSLIDSTGKSLSTIVGNTNLTLTDKSTANVTLEPEYTTASASTRTKAVKITGNDYDNSLHGGKGADTLIGDKGNDTLWGGKGKDIFVYNSGNDVIADYASGDKISLSAPITKTATKGLDVALTVGEDDFTIKNAKGKSLDLINADGENFSIIVGNPTLTLTDKSKAKINLSDDYANANAFDRSKAIQIKGNDYDNSILGGKSADKIYGGKGNDTLTGGAGNDSLWGNAGKDTFIYASGDDNDIIYGFANDDMLKITDKFSGTYNKKKDEIYFKVGETANAITLKNFSATRGCW